MIDVNIVCQDCGTFYTATIDAENKTSLCTNVDCISKKDKCIKCNKVARFTQPDKETGNIVDVCEQHFVFMHMG